MVCIESALDTRNTCPIRGAAIRRSARSLKAETPSEERLKSLLSLLLNVYITGSARSALPVTPVMGPCEGFQSRLRPIESSCVSMDTTGPDYGLLCVIMALLKATQPTTCS